MSGNPSRRWPPGLGTAIGMCVGAGVGVVVGAILVGSDPTTGPLLAAAVLIGIVAGFLIGGFVDLSERRTRR